MGLFIDCPACFFFGFSYGEFFFGTHCILCFHFFKDREKYYMDGRMHVIMRASARLYGNTSIIIETNPQTCIDHDRNTHNDTADFSRSIRSKILESGRLNIDKQRIESFCYARW